MESQNPPSKKRPGRPSLDPSQATVPIQIRLTADQRDKLGKLGGAPWVREKIDKAKLPKE
ncbi:hypothetical protein [Variovorax sp.]|uniref:hypothetical protein n=1 Tax=Variovorax sp. TaxID=1871043 RepID=UPI003BAC7194